MKRRILKYATGDTVPAGAVYLSTVVQTSIPAGDEMVPCWRVWHYYSVEQPA